MHARARGLDSKHKREHDRRLRPRAVPRAQRDGRRLQVSQVPARHVRARRAHRGVHRVPRGHVHRGHGHEGHERLRRGELWRRRLLQARALVDVRLPGRLLLRRARAPRVRRGRRLHAPRVLHVLRVRAAPARRQGAPEGAAQGEAAREAQAAGAGALVGVRQREPHGGAQARPEQEEDEEEDEYEDDSDEDEDDDDFVDHGDVELQESARVVIKKGKAARTRRRRRRPAAASAEATRCAPERERRRPTMTSCRPAGKSTRTTRPASCTITTSTPTSRSGRARRDDLSGWRALSATAPSRPPSVRPQPQGPGGCVLRTRSMHGPLRTSRHTPLPHSISAATPPLEAPIEAAPAHSASTGHQPRCPSPPPPRDGNVTRCPRQVLHPSDVPAGSPIGKRVRVGKVASGAARARSRTRGMSRDITTAFLKRFPDSSGPRRTSPSGPGRSRPMRRDMNFECASDCGSRLEDITHLDFFEFTFANLLAPTDGLCSMASASAGMCAVAERGQTERACDRALVRMTNLARLGMHDSPRASCSVCGVRACSACQCRHGAQGGRSGDRVGKLSRRPHPASDGQCA